MAVFDVCDMVVGVWRESFRRADLPTASPHPTMLVSASSELNLEPKFPLEGPSLGDQMQKRWLLEQIKVTLHSCNIFLKMNTVSEWGRRNHTLFHFEF